MKQELENLVKSSLNKLNIDFDNISLTHTKDKKFGDFTTNVAMALAKNLGKNPRDFASEIIANLPTSEIITKAEVAGPGFINFYLQNRLATAIIDEILQNSDNFGTSNFGANKKVLVEFVSANPTGPLHIGHGRGAAFGDSLTRLLNKVGFQAQAEYYVNDAGRQMDILAVSVYLRYINDVNFPSNGYKGDYIQQIADNLKGMPVVDIKDGAFPDESQNGDTQGDREKHIDDLIANAKELLQDDYQKIFNLALGNILANIKDDLNEFRVSFDEFFSEKSLTNLISSSIEKLEQNQVIYQKNGAKWFKTTNFNDEKDRVVVRENGLHTYFAADIAYHQQKLERGFDRLINIWGADHHGYIARVKAGVKALGFDEDKLDILLVQFANLYRGKTKVPMSTRSGEFVTLKELYDEVGVDATRFFYILRKSDQHLDFDLELAKSKTNDNPVFYIQYAYARIASVLAKDSDISDANLSLLTDNIELDLIKELRRFKDVLLASAKSYELHQIAYYLQHLASIFHSYYNNSEFLIENIELKKARLSLISAVQIVIQNGMDILGVSCPEQM
jgi:arginyl-tRNA synthetase